MVVKYHLVSFFKISSFIIDLIFLQQIFETVKQTGTYKEKHTSVGILLSKTGSVVDLDEKPKKH